MSEVFLKTINMSISASWLILAVLILRLVLKKAPKWVNVLLWGIVSIRLLCPFSIESALSLIPTAQTVRPEIMLDRTPTVDTGVGFVNSMVNPVIAGSFTPDPAASANPLQILIPVWSILWLTGIGLMLLYTAISYWRLRRKVNTAVLLQDNIFQSEHVRSPFVLGIIKPRIYLPFKLEGEKLVYVIAHERSHIRRKDHLWKPLGFLLLSIHWFNPLIWLAYVLLCRDIELACDEKVIKELDAEQRADYTQALVACSIDRRMIAACPLAFGEVGVKTRVKSVMNYKKPAFWIIILTIAVCIAVAVCFLTDPVGSSGEPDLSFLNYKNAASLVAEQEEVMVIYCPTSDDGSGSMIQIGTASGAELAKYLEQWDWKKCKAPRQSLSSPGSVEFLIEDDYRITVYQRKRGSLRQYAVVRHQEETCYYRIDSHDYPDAVALVFAPAEKPAPEVGEEKWDLIAMVMVDGELYLTTGYKSNQAQHRDGFDGQITSTVDGSEQPVQNDQSNFGDGYGYQYGTMDGTIEIYMNGDWWIYATEEVREKLQFSSTDMACELNFAGNTSMQHQVELTEEQPYWYAHVINDGGEAINVDFAGTVYRVESGTSATIFTDKEWKPGTYTVGFATSGASGMVGSAVCSTSSVPVYGIGAVIEHDLRNGNLELPAEKLKDYVFLTNSQKIGVTVKSDKDFEGAVILKNYTEGDVEIMYCDVSNQENECLFQNLTSALLYGVTHEGLEDCTLVIQGVGFGWIP